METTQEYLLRVYNEQPDIFNGLAVATIKRFIGLEKAASGGSCTSQNCSGTTGCHPTTAHGACSCINPNTCAWVPDLGLVAG